jgi:molybdopterin synthase sulfur carrier subunit
VNHIISVNIKLIGVFRELSKKNQFPLKLEEPAVVKKVIHRLTETFSPKFKQALIDPDLNDPRPNTLILVNGKEINVLDGLETKLNKGDEVVIVPVSHGG